MSKGDLISLVADDKVLEFQNMDKFLEIVNQNPPDAWLERHPFAKDVLYIPIERIEWMLDKMFQEWHPEVLREGQLLNSVYCVVRLHYKHPITGWKFTDGVAAVPAKTSKGAKASDMSEILSEAVMTGLPAAKSFAIKDAADHIGKIFGRDINRKTNLEFVGSYSKSEEDELLDKFKNAETPQEITKLLSGLDPAMRRAFTPVAENRLKDLRNG
jgi:hypothetical protein